MDYLRENKKKLIKNMFITSIILLAIRLAFFLQDGTSDLVESILIWIIALISCFIMFLIILPVNSTLHEFYKKYRELFLFNTFIFIIEYVFIIENNLELTRTSFFAIACLLSIINVICILIPRNLKKFVITFTIVYVPLCLIIQDIYYSVFSDFGSFKEIVTIKEGLESAGGVVHVKGLYIFLLLMIVTTIYLFFKVENDIRLEKNKVNYKKWIVPLLFFLLLNINSQIPPKSSRLHLSDHYLYYSIYNNKRFVSSFGSVNYLVRDFFDTIIPEIPNKKYISDIDDFYSNSNKVHIENEYTGIFEGKNLVFVVVESLDYMVINETLTPNMYKLKNEGIDFQNHYVPVYPRTTSDTEFIYNTGLIPSVTDGPTCYMFNENAYSNSLANSFNKKGYLTNGLHSNYKEFYTRYKVYDGFGYDNFYGQNEMGLSETEKRYDSIFFEKGKDFILPEDEPFMSFMVTLSGHSPFTNDNLAIKKNYDIVDKYYGDSAPKEVKSYIAAEIEADLFVGELLDELEAKNMMDDTVVILTTDHYPYTMTPEVYEEYTNIEDDYLKMHSPLVIWSNDIEHQTVDKLTSSFDLLPTIANLFNLDVDYNYYFGNDAFNDNYKPLVIYKDYSWYDGDNYVLYGKLEAGSADKEYIDETTSYVDRYFDIGKKILRVDYFHEKIDYR